MDRAWGPLLHPGANRRGLQQRQRAWRARAQRLPGVRRQQLSDRFRSIDVELRCRARSRADVHRCGGRCDDHGRRLGCERRNRHDHRHRTGVRAAVPTITMSPGSMVSAAAGAGVSYTLTVRNNDSSTCAASTFGLSSLVPSGWTGAFGVAALSLNPGASANTSMLVTTSQAASGQSRSRLARCARARADWPPDPSTSSRH